MQVLYYTSQLKLLSDHANESVWNHSSVNLKVNHQVGIVCTEQCHSDMIWVKCCRHLSTHIKEEAYSLCGFLSGTGGEESACHAGDITDTGSVPGSGRSLGGGHGTHSNALA